MTQGMPVIAGVDNTADQTTGITYTSDGIIGTAIDATTKRTARNALTGGSAVNASIQIPNGTAVYAIGQGRGLYAVGTDDVAVSAYSYNSSGMVSYGNLNGVEGDSVNPNASGVYGENKGNGFGVAGRSGSGGGRPPRVNAGAGVWGDHTGFGQGVLGTSDSGIGVLGRTSGSVAILAENQSGRANTTAVTALGGSGVGLLASGGRAAIRLSPAAIAGAPTTGGHEMGELMVDSTGTLFLCKAAGTPGRWVRVA